MLKTGTDKLRIILLLLATAFITAGAMTGGFTELWIKAAMICRECIGLG